MGVPVKILMFLDTLAELLGCFMRLDEIRTGGVVN